MLKLSENWLTEGLLDVEYKQYEFMAYLKKVEDKFNRLELYPYFTDILYHYESLLSYRDNKLDLLALFPKKLIDISLENTELIYEDLIPDAEYLNNIDKLVEFAIPKLRQLIRQGKFVYDEVERCVDVIELGIRPIYRREGYFMIEDGDIQVYEYQLGVFDGTTGSRILKTKLIRSYPKEFQLSYDSIRLDLVNESKLINPSTFLIDTPIRYPFEQTLLPVVKRILIKMLS